jgi:tetratricopeptide (TPR) repeat protein
VRTDHFVLTVDDTEQNAREFGLRLERFDAALRLLYGVSDNSDQRARPIAIYAMKADLFYQSCGWCPGVLGYYRPRAQGSFIFSQHMPEMDRKTKVGWWSSQTLLLHEYSHHFTYFHFPIAYPRWFSEGFAEFNANVSFEDDGAIIIGYPANYRAAALKEGDVSLNKLLDPQRYGGIDNVDLFYGRGWLLTHYLLLSPQRKGQLTAYLDGMNHGKSSIDAARSAFGDLNKLDKELDAYRRGKLLAPLRIPPGKNPLNVAVTTLSPGEATMLPAYTPFISGIAKGYRLGGAQRAGKIAARYPDDAVVQARSAEIEMLAGRLDRADSAADRALALKPDLADALLRKGMIAAQRARDKKAMDTPTWNAVRSWYLKANHIDPNAVMPLFLYYSSFVETKATPPPAAVRAIMRAEVLAPESGQIRLALARQLLLTDDARSARLLLQPIAFAPHSARNENVAREIIDLIDAGKIAEAKALMTKGEDEDSDIGR